MIIHAISRYQSSSSKNGEGTIKPAKSHISRTIPTDTYEASGAEVQGKGKSADVREDLLKTVKKRIGSGFYNTTDVLEDLSTSFATALNQTIS
jgi:hypothetical protein